MWQEIVNAAANVANSIVTPVQNKKMQKRQFEENERNRKFAIDQANDQYTKERDMLKSADSLKVQSLKNAGMNPALAYGGEAPVLNPSVGNSVQGQVAPQNPVGPAIAGLGAAALQFDQQALTRSVTRKNNAEAESQEIENQHTKSTDEIMKLLNDPEQLKNAIINDVGSLEGLNKIQQHKKLRAERQLSEISAKVEDWTSELRMQYPEYFVATIAKDSVQNENTQMDTSLKESQISNVEQDTKLKGAQTTTESARYGLVKAQTVEAIARKHSLDMDSINKVLQRGEIAANISKMNSLAKFYNARTDTEKVNRWLKLDESMSATLAYVQELKNKGTLTPEEAGAIKDLVIFNGIKVVGNFVGRTIEHGTDRYIDYKYEKSLQNSSKSVQQPDMPRGYPNLNPRPKQEPNWDDPSVLKDLMDQL